MGGGGVVMTGASHSRCHLYQGRVTGSIVLTAIIAASGGLLFGFDNGITGGVIAQRAFQETFFPAMLVSHAAEDTGGGLNCNLKQDIHLQALIPTSIRTSAQVPLAHTIMHAHVDAIA
jgi:hypothetical protein